jgi:hypothetical protein
MGRQIVQDDEVAGLEGRGQLGFDGSLEDVPIHQRIDDEWRGEHAAAEAGDEGLRLPMAERDLGEKSLAFGATAAQAGHLGGGSGLVEEDQPMRLKPHLRLANADPFLARLFDVGPIVLAGPQSFFETAAGANEPAQQRSGISLLAGRGGEKAARSSMVMSTFSTTYAKRNDRCGSSLAWRRPPLGFGSNLPRVRTAFIRFTTKETETNLKCAAAARRE